MADCSLTDMINYRLIVSVMKRMHIFQAQHTDVSFPPRWNVQHAPQPSATLSKCVRIQLWVFQMYLSSQ